MRDGEAVDATTSLGSYAHPVLRRMITAFKYQSATCLTPSFINLLRRYENAYGPIEACILVPIPSSNERILERGFDHVARLTQLVREELVPDAEIRNILRRTKQSVSNADLEDPAARRGNVIGSFEVVGDVPERVLLIDDVVTSGATAEECAKLLRAHGANEVSLFTMASGG